MSALLNGREPVPLAQIAAHVQMAPSNVYRYLVSFGEGGLTVQDPTSGRYGLGPLAVQLGLEALRRMDGMEIALRALEEARSLPNISGIHLNVWGTAGTTVVRWISGAGGSISLRIGEGTVLPLATSATGRLWAALTAPAAIEPLLSAEIAQLARERKITASKLNADLSIAFEEIKRIRLSFSSGEQHFGFDAIAAPIFDRFGEMVFSMTAIGNPTQADLRADGNIAARLRELCSLASGQLGFTTWNDT
ncbi:IclR family transcriptional regulator [Rhizorhabdus dicambivorans]|uniref:IclR family transcriptional regulator n=1 Tax=Rhizorhabdus dicambivorans TaxID=1850238 RepID=A0A2A4FXR7_9SPHN|nr:IclR family transcriptional regulator C-terminal domain-containing protein [Rhizorhabdus dicambivorans]ATE64182.1 hypothetical protein CMV14_07080 [Rhizorhabdus dicambivorans]PCE42546.1 hypothetical protein COO09_09000 [Rhizorhabdus dicambivorans]